MKRTLLTALAVLAVVPFQSAQAAGDSVTPPHKHWGFHGYDGTYDKAALQRGLKVYREVCSACHSLKRIAFRNLADLGYNEDQIKAIASEYTIQDGPDEEGEMFDRPGIPSDYFPSPFPNKQAAAAVHGMVPPDLSLITKARKHGADYVHAILTGYEAAPEGEKLKPGQHWNKYMPAHVIAMAAPLSDELVEYEDGTPMTVDQYARDVAEFLTWAAEPEMEDRKRIGLNVLLFLTIFAFVMYGVKRKIWADVH